MQYYAFKHEKDCMLENLSISQLRLMRPAVDLLRYHCALLGRAGIRVAVTDSGDVIVGIVARRFGNGVIHGPSKAHGSLGNHIILRPFNGGYRVTVADVMVDRDARAIQLDVVFTSMPAPIRIPISSMTFKPGQDRGVYVEKADLPAGGYSVDALIEAYDRKRWPFLFDQDKRSVQDNFPTRTVSAGRPSGKMLRLFRRVARRLTPFRDEQRAWLLATRIRVRLDAMGLERLDGRLADQPDGMGGTGMRAYLSDRERLAWRQMSARRVARLVIGARL